MKTRSILLSLLATVSLASFVSCVNQLEDDGMSRKEKKEFEAIPNGTPMNVKFHIGDIKCSTRSSFTTEEDAVSNLNILVYRAGELITSAYTEDVDESVIILRLAKGEQYNLYALANCGEVSLKTESELLAYQYTIPSLSSLNNGYPMCWSRTDFTISTIVPDVSIELERLVAKVSFSLDPGVLDGLEVTSVRLMQSSKVVSPFGLNRAAASSSQVMAGDYASATDLTQLNNGGSIIMYVPENCQGTLLEGNTDPWGKTPDNISKGDVCTYIEVGCSFNEGFALSGDVIYRMYLGNDNCANFDVVRNSIYNISLLLTGDGLNEVSWKVDSDVDYTGSGITIELSYGLHEPYDLYIGEENTYNLILPSTLTKLLDLKNCSVVAVTSNSSLTPSPNILVSNILSDSDDNATINIKGTNITTAYLKLIDQNGKEVGNISTGEDNIVRVKKPCIRFTSSSFNRTDIDNNRIENFTEESRKENSPVVNGANSLIYLWIVDDRGYSFNREEGTLDPTFYNDITIKPTVISNEQTLSQKEAIESSLRSSLIQNANNNKFQSYSPSYKYEISYYNEGVNKDLCVGLSNICSTDLNSINPQIRYSITGKNIISAEFNDYIQIFPIQVINIGPLAPEKNPLETLSIDWSLHSDEAGIGAIAVKNPSRLAFNFKQYYFEEYDASKSSTSSNNRYLFVETKRPEIKVSAISLPSPTAWLISKLDHDFLPAQEGKEYEGRDGEYDIYATNFITSGATGSLGSVLSLMNRGVKGRGQESISCVVSTSGKKVIEDRDTQYPPITQPDFPYLDYFVEHNSAGSNSPWFYDGVDWYGLSHFYSLWEPSEYEYTKDYNNNCEETRNNDIYKTITPEYIEQLVNAPEISPSITCSSIDGIKLSINDNSGNAGGTYIVSANVYFGIELKYTKDGSTWYYETGRYAVDASGNKYFTTELYLNKMATQNVYYVSSQRDSNVPSITNKTVSLSNGGSTSMVLLSANEISKTFLYLNRNYWKACTSNTNYYDDGTGVLRRNNRYTKFAMPKELTIEVFISSTTNSTKPVQFTLSCPTSTFTCSTGYGNYLDRTAAGYYASNSDLTTNWAYARTNPDGSTRTGYHKKDANINTIVLYDYVDNGMPATNYVKVESTGVISNSNITTSSAIKTVSYTAGISGDNSWIRTNRETGERF